MYRIISESTYLYAYKNKRVTTITVRNLSFCLASNIHIRSSIFKSHNFNFLDVLKYSSDDNFSAYIIDTAIHSPKLEIVLIDLAARREHARIIHAPNICLRVLKILRIH